MQDRYISDDQCISRLKEEYDRYGNLFIAFDFDNTVFDYHGKGDNYPVVEHLLVLCSSLNLTLILFTAKETKEELDACVSYCRSRGYSPKFINENPLMNTKKPYYNILLDDRAGLNSAVSVLREVLYYIERKLMEKV